MSLGRTFAAGAMAGSPRRHDVPFVDRKAIVDVVNVSLNSVRLSLYAYLDTVTEVVSYVQQMSRSCTKMSKT